MVLTKKTRIEWASLSEQTGTSGLNPVRDEKIYIMMLEDKTDGVPNNISEVITERSWIDQAAAQEYIDMIVTTITKLGLTPPKTEILDIVV